MKEKKVFLSLITIILILSLILFSEIGYAVDTTLFTNTTSIQPEFDVSFNTNYSNEFVSITNSNSVTLKEIHLNTPGQTQNFLIPLSNNSKDLSAKISIDIENSNPDYFEITCQVSNKNLKPQSNDFVKITIKLIKSPNQGCETCNFSIKLNAAPIYK